MVSQNHDCQLHHGDLVSIGSYEVYAGGINLSDETLANTDLLVTFCDRPPLNLGSQELDHKNFTMEDFGGVPRFFATFLVAHVIPAMEAGKRVTVHCEGGFGRTGTVLAGLIVLLEPDVDDPVAAVRERYCPRAVETRAQRDGIIELRDTERAKRATELKEGGIMSEPDNNDKWHMAGTEGTGEYRVLAMNDTGRLGFRVLENGKVRIRIEPTTEGKATLAETFTVDAGWKQPGDFGQQRFSKVVSMGDETISTVVAALKAMRKEGRLTRNFKQWYWRKHVKHATTK